MKFPDGLSSVEGLKSEGFAGFVTVADLRCGQDHMIPATPGVYLFVRNNASPPDFLVNGTGGQFKGRNPNVSLKRLADEWVEGAAIVYAGQTDGELRRRINAMIEFGQGRPVVGHWGGRLVWQLKEADRLRVCWKETGPLESRAVEKALIGAFKSLHAGCRPFANLRD